MRFAAGLVTRASRHLHPNNYAYRTKRLVSAGLCVRMSAATWNPASGLHYEGPQVVPALKEHKSTLIMIHGLGDTSFGWSDIAGNRRAKDKPNWPVHT